MPIVTIKGEILADGKLTLPELPVLPAGPVSVTIRTLGKTASRVGGDVLAGRQVDEAAGDMASYENLPEPGER